MLHPNRNSFFVSWGAGLALALLAAGCTIDTRSCRDGFRFPVNDAGRVVGDCEEIPRDAGADQAMDDPCAACDERLCIDDVCVPCVDDDDCDGATPFCSDDNECVSCTEAPDRCTGATSVCDAGSGACVQCTRDQADACGPAGCTFSSNTCSAFGTTQRTCEPCDTDANCATDHRCVPMEFDGAALDGGYCLQFFDNSGCARPYGQLLRNRITLSNESGRTYCGIDESQTTCGAVRGLLEARTCPGGTDDECPQPGGLCRTVGALPNQCTYACSNAFDCPESEPGDTCDRSYCGG